MACVLFTTAKKNYYLHHNRRYLCSHKEKNGICLIRTCALIKSLSIIIFWVVGTAVFPIVIAFDSKSEQKPITKEKAADCRGGHRILFIHIPKAGGTSIKFALKRMKSFTLWTNHQYHWEKYVKWELNKDPRIPRNLILEHHVSTTPLGKMYSDISILKRNWDSRGIAHFSFVIIREPVAHHASLYSWCSKAKFRGRKYMLPKLWSSVVKCVRPNSFVSYLKDGKMCARNSEIRDLADCNITQMQGWFKDLYIFDLNEFDLLQERINNELAGCEIFPKPHHLNERLVLREAKFEGLEFQKMNITECKFSEPSLKRLELEAFKQVKSGLKKDYSRAEIESHLNCDVQLYRELIKM